MIDEPHIWMQMPDYLEAKRESGERLTKNELAIKLLSESSYALELVYQLLTEMFSEIESGVEGVADRDLIDAIMTNLYEMAEHTTQDVFAHWRLAPGGKQPVTVEVIIKREQTET
jgi:hypothetical protein